MLSVLIHCLTTDNFVLCWKLSSNKIEAVILPLSGQKVLAILYNNVTHQLSLGMTCCGTTNELFSF